MAAADRIKCFLVLSVTTGHEPEPELDFEGVYTDRSEADAKRREVQEETSTSGISVDGATFVDVIEADCAKLGLVPGPKKDALVIGVNDYVSARSYAVQIDNPALEARLRELGEEGDWDEFSEVLRKSPGEQSHIVASASEYGTPVKYLVELE